MKTNSNLHSTIRLARRLTAFCLLAALPMMSCAQEKLFVLGGELSNSAATCTQDIDEVIPRMKTLGLNTVLVPAYWEFLEPVEGQFDFTLIDRTIEQARQNDLNVVFLWFGAWKNSMSCYAPVWFKQDTKRFPRARTEDGKPLEIATAFSEQVFQADNRAFGQLVSHISQTAADVVSMIQVENEIGMLESPRDHSTLAEAEYHKGVPQELLSYLKKNQKTLHPWLAARFNAKGTSWAEVFGDDMFTDEIFMAYYYAKYVGRLCQTARQHTSMPLYVNAAMNSRGRLPGQYPSAGPLAHLVDIWHAAAPQLLCLAPDIYDAGFKTWAEQYALPNNPLFIPESRCCENSGARAMYVFGEHHALGFSPFAIDQATALEAENVTKAYDLLRQLSRISSEDVPAGSAPFGSKKRSGSAAGKGFSTPFSQLSTRGILLNQDERECIIDDQNTVITCRHYFTLPWAAPDANQAAWPEAGAMLVKIGKNEYLLAGTSVVLTFATRFEKERQGQLTLGEDGFAASSSPSASPASALRQANGGKTRAYPRLGIAAIDEVCIDQQGHIVPIRRHNGDQSHQGRHAAIPHGQWKILHIRLYDYD